MLKQLFLDIGLLWLSAVTYLKLRGAYFFHFKGPHFPRHSVWKGVLRLSIYHKLLWQRGRIGEDRDRVLPSSCWGQQEVQLQPFKVDLQTAHGTAVRLRGKGFQLRKKLLDGKQEMSTWRNWDLLMGISWQKLTIQYVRHLFLIKSSVDLFKFSFAWKRNG